MASEELLEATTAALRTAGCLAPAEEAAELVAAAGGDALRLAGLIARRSRGEPLAWLTGGVRFCDCWVHVDAGVYVPRWQSEPLALEAVRRLPERGVAVDLCTGAGPIALVLATARPQARIIATEIDPLAIACARRNGIEVLEGDLTAPLPEALAGRVDVVTAVAPYVPTGELRFLPRDVLAYEPRLALDGGRDGAALLARIVEEAAVLLAPGGSLLLELGGEEATLLEPVLTAGGYRDRELLRDEDGELRALCCRR